MVMDTKHISYTVLSYKSCHHLMSLICAGINVSSNIKLVYCSHPIIMYVCLLIKNAHHTAHLNDCH